MSADPRQSPPTSPSAPSSPSSAPAPSSASSPVQWAILRDQLNQSSKPNLSNSTRSSSFILLVLSSISILTHLSSIYLNLSSPPPDHPTSKRPFNSLRPLKPNNRFGIHQPNLPIILPIIFSIHAILNIASISSLLSDASRFKFKGHTTAIQQLNYSLLLSAGILLVWALACGLSPLQIRILPRSRSNPSTNSKRFQLRSINPRSINWLGYSSLMIVFLVCIPCIIITTISTESMNSLDGFLMNLIDQILLVDDQSPSIDQPTLDRLVTKALATIAQLDQTSDLLYTHIRMLSGLHLLLTFIVLLASLSVASIIIRNSRRQQFQPLEHSHPPLKSIRSSNEIDHRSELIIHHQNQPSPHAHPLDRLNEPEPALILNPNRRLRAEAIPRSPPPTIELEDQEQRYSTIRSTITTTTIINEEGEPSEGVELKNQIDPSNDSMIINGMTAGDRTANDRSRSNTCFINHHHHEDDVHQKSYFVDNQTRKSTRISNHIKKIKFILAIVLITSLSFIVLNFCIVANLFKYPDEISIGDLLILTLEWSTWIWNGSISPLIGIINCWILFNKKNNRYQNHQVKNTNHHHYHYRQHNYSLKS